MLKIVYVVTMLFSLQSLCAQKKIAYLVKAGETPAEVLPHDAMYALPAFTDGTIYLRDGTFSRQLLNYNFALGEMQFIGPQKDTLAIADPAIIKNIVVDTLVYYYEKGFLQIISNLDTVKLAVKESLTETKHSVEAAYNQSSASSAVSTYGSLTSYGRMYYLQVKKDVMFTKISAYYIGDRFNHFLKADKKNFLNLFPEKRQAVQKYLDNNHVNFEKEDELKKFFSFCINAKE